MSNKVPAVGVIVVIIIIIIYHPVLWCIIYTGNNSAMQAKIKDYALQHGVLCES